MKKEQVVSQGYSAFFLVSINVAGVATLSVVLIGYTLYISVGFLGSLATIIICCIVLYFISTSIMRVAINYRVNTMEIATNYFGKRGTPLCSIMIGAAFCGWFIWQLSTLTYFLKNIAFVRFPFLYHTSHTKINFVCALLCILVAASGKKGLRFFVLILNPLLVILSFLVMIPLLKRDPTMASFRLIQSSGISLSTLSSLLSALAAHTLSTPTFYRFASSPSVALRSLKIVYFGVLPFFCGMGVLIALLSPYQSIFEIFETARGWWPIFFTFYSFLGCWTVCILNLHYGADAFAHIFALGENQSMILLMGLLCTGIICFDIQMSAQISNAFGIMAIGVLTIIITRAAMNGMNLNRDSRSVQMGNSIALICSNIVSFLTIRGYVEITGVPFFDSMLVAFCVCAYFSTFRHPKRLSFSHDA